jgi:HK97 family phage major capsid protein
MSEELKKLSAEIQATQKEYVDALKECIKSEDLKGALEPLLKEKEEALNTKLTDLEDSVAKIKAMEDEISNLKQSANFDPSGRKEEESEKRKAALNNLLRKGLGMDQNQPMNLIHLSKEEQELFGKSMISGSNQDGGFMTINEMATEISLLEKERSPVRSLVTVRSGSGPAWEQPVQTERMSANRTGETAPRPKTDTGAIQKQIISAEEMYAMPDVSQTMLDDASFDLVGYLNSEIADEFSILEGTEFATGTGVKEFRGITTLPDGTGFGELQQLETASAGVLSYADFVDMDEVLLPGFVPGASWLMNRTTRGFARKIVDSTGNPILLNRLANTEDSTLPEIFGKPVVDVPDMPNVGSGGSGNLSIAYGDFRRSYLIYDRFGIRILRDPFTNKPFVLFYTTKRSGGDVIKHQGIKLLRTK